MNDVKIVNDLDIEEWSRFASQTPGGNIFHTPEMFQVFQRTRGFSPQIWAALDEQSKILALLLPVNISLMPGLLRHVTTRAVVFGGVLHAPGQEGLLALGSLLEAYRRAQTPALFTELRNMTDPAQALPVLEARQFHYEGHLNYLIDLSGGPQAVMQNIGTRTRKNLRHGLNKGEVVIEILTDRSRLPEFYALLQKTYRNARVPLTDISMFEAAYDILSQQGMVRFSMARVGSVYAAASVELLYRDVVFGWYGGVDRAFSKYIPNDLLTWNILEWASAKGYRVYDFGGAGKPEEEYKVRDFKAKFGGELVSFGRNVYVHSPLLLRVSTFGYALLRGFLR